ncbi:MAG: hypothetical protein V4462_05510 [Pseudomonadota bacterium]
MSQRIKVAELPGFDPAAYLDSEETIGAYLADVLAANDAALLAAALDDIARARAAAAAKAAAPPTPPSRA